MSSFECSTVRDAFFYSKNMSYGILFLGIFWGFFFFVLSIGRRKASHEEMKKTLKRRLIISFGILFAILLFLFIARPGM